MSENDIVRARRLPEGPMVEEPPDGSPRPLQDRTDWERLAAMTDEEIDATALADPDNPPLTDEELARLRPAPQPRRIRERLNLTQEPFAEQFEIPLGTLRDWEQGVGLPDTSARTLLRVIEQDPEAVRNALKQSYIFPRPRPAR